MRTFTIAFSALALVTLPAVAEVDPRYDPDKVICKTKHVTGSRLATERQCLTRRQWNELSNRTQEHHEEQMEYGRRMNAPRG